MSEERLECLEGIDFAIQNIPQIQSVYEIKEHWGHKITDITESRHDLLGGNTMATSMFVGQENYFFGFRERKRLIGEFSIDFLPVNANEYIRKRMRSIVKTRKPKLPHSCA